MKKSKKSKKNRQNINKMVDEMSYLTYNKIVQFHMLLSAHLNLQINMGKGNSSVNLERSGHCN